VSLVWSADTRVAVQEHAERGYPDEVCGLLIGSFDGDDKVVRQVVPVENEWEAVDERRRRFLITPDVFAWQERQARRDGLEIVGFYHSHPDHPAEPSATDREFAWPLYSYLIQSVAGGRVAEFASWRLKDDRSGYEREEVTELKED
jgi:proteasome lid subunit RPN8/RPN11